MPTVASLLVKIGANDQEIQKALASVGEKAKSLNADLSKLGNTPLAGQAQKSLENLKTAMDQITKAQQDIANRATAAAQGIEAFGGASKLTDSQLKQMNKTLQDGLSAFKALGQDAPEQLKRMVDAVGAIKPASDGAFVSFGQLVASFVSAQAIISLLETGFHDLTGFVTDSVKAAGDAEKAHTQLVAALRAQGTAIPSVISAYEGYAKALQRTTIFQDDAIEGAIALMVQIGDVMPRDMEKALKATTNLASGLGIDLDTATRMVAKAAEGNVTALQKTGVVLDETTKKSGDFGKVLDAINEKFGGQAAALASTYQGRLQQLSNTWNNVEESIGRVITQNATVLRAFELINDEIDKNTGELKQNRSVTNLVSDAVIIAVRAFAELAKAIDLAQTGEAGLELFARRGGQAIANLGIVVLQAARAMAFLRVDPAGFKQATGLITDLQNAVKTLGERNQSTVERSTALGNALQEIGAKADGLAADLEKTRGKTVELTDVTDGSSDAWTRHTKAIDTTGESTKKATKDFEELQQALIDLQDESDRVFAGILLDINSIKIGNGAALFGPAQIRTPSIEGLFGPTGAVQNPQGGIFPAAGPAKIGPKTFDVGPAAASFADNLAASIPNSILAAIQGGGSKLQAAGSAVGLTLFGKDSAITKSISSVFSKDGFLGKTLSSAVPIIGSLIGPAIEGLGKLWNKVFGTAGRDAVRDFASSQGGFDTLHQKLGALGADGEALWKSLTQGVGRNNPEQAKAAIDAINKAFDAQKQKILALQGTLTTVGGRLSAITTLTPSLQSALDKAFNAKKPEDFESALAGINGELDKQQAKFDLIKNTLAKYGISFTQAGSAFKQAALNQTANEYIDDFNTLNDAGVDVKTTVHGMSDNLSKFAQDAKKAGVEVPEAMRSILQAAIDNGELFDENGKKITDMKDLGLTFGTTMETVMKKTIPDAIAKLTTVLEGLAKFLGITLPGAAEDGADQTQAALDGITPPDLTFRPTVDLSGLPSSSDFPQPQQIEGSSTGSIVRPWGLQHFASGGIAGPDNRLVAVSDGELIMNVAQQKNVAGALQGGGGDIIINFNGTVLAAKEYIEQHVVEPVLTGIDRYHRARFGRLVAAVTP